MTDTVNIDGRGGCVQCGAADCGKLPAPRPALHGGWCPACMIRSERRELAYLGDCISGAVQCPWCDWQEGMPFDEAAHELELVFEKNLTPAMRRWAMTVCWQLQLIEQSTAPLKLLLLKELRRESSTAKAVARWWSRWMEGKTGELQTALAEGAEMKLDIPQDVAAEALAAFHMLRYEVASILAASSHGMQEQLALDAALKLPPTELVELCLIIA